MDCEAASRRLAVDRVKRHLELDDCGVRLRKPWLSLGAMAITADCVLFLWSPHVISCRGSIHNC